MAQRTGADRFLAPRAKARSVAIATLLAAALLLLSGCGGDSDTQPASTPSPSAEQRGSNTSAQGGGGKEGASGQAPQSSSGSGGGQQGAGKQSERVTLPEGSPEPAPTPAERAQATVASIVLTSPDLQGTTTLPAPYTCEGKDTWPALRWSGVPQGTGELALFAMGAEPIGEELFFGWAVAGLDPSLTGIESGRLPKGAIVGQNSFGKTAYSICPPNGKAETFIFALYAYPEALGPKSGFEPFELRNEILTQAGSVGLMAVEVVVR